ncbi:MAG: hypothetical protein F6K42_24210 [Leptolyngbya sp. SIO1D8]|nr:hypothetical protein [Leptolyngbya sp. SIO1D8]
MASLPKQRQMVFHKVSMRLSKSDAAYWRTQPYTMRLAALESIRQEFIYWKYGTQPGFQRVYTVVKR